MAFTSRSEDILRSILEKEEYNRTPQSRIEELLILLGDLIKEGGSDPEMIKQIVDKYLEESPLQEEIDEKATLYKLYFDGSAIFRSFEDFEEYNPMTFQEILDLCYEEPNMVYIGDGQMKYYPQLDLNVSSKEAESIEFISTAQLDRKNMHTRIIINANEEVRTDQIIDAPMSELAKLKDHTEKEFGDLWTIIHNEHPSNFLEIQKIVQNGDAGKVFKIGDQISVPWKDTAANTQYNMDFDVVAFRDVELEDGRTVPGMILQSHWTSPFGIQFSGNNALYYAANGLPAGTYNFEIGTNWGSNCIAGKKYQFTTTQDIPAGGQILIGRLSGSTVVTTGGMSDYAPSTWRILTYASNAAIDHLEVLELTEGSTGTSLGKTASSIKWSDNSDIWNLQAAAFGYNRWSQSAIRQFLNSAEEKSNWWTPQHRFDRRPDELTSKDGFLRGFGEDFLSVLGKAKVQTACNYITDGGSSSVPVIDTTYDTFWLPSLEEEYCVPQVPSVEGFVLPYWRERLPIDSPQASGSAAALTEHIRYALNAKTSVQGVRFRSANRYSAYSTWYVYSTGNVNNYGSAYSNRFAPLCVIC